MKFKLDENLPAEIVDDLKKLGFEADTVAAEGLTGGSDPTVVNAALVSDRILLTLDKGIASLLEYPVGQHAGIVLFRPDAFGRGAVRSFVRERPPELLKLEVKNRLAIVGASRIRLRY